MSFTRPPRAGASFGPHQAHGGSLLPVCEDPEGVEAGLELGAQLDGIEPLILGGECGAVLRREDAARQQPLVGRLRAIVPLEYPGPVARFGEQLADGVKEVHVRPQPGVDGREGFERRPAAGPVVADKPAEHRPIFLLDVRLLVLPMRPAAGDGDALLATPRHEHLVEKLPRRCPYGG